MAHEHKHKHVVLNVFIPDKSDNTNVFHGVNGLAMRRHKTGKTKWLCAGNDSLVQEPSSFPAGGMPRRAMNGLGPWWNSGPRVT